MNHITFPSLLKEYEELLQAQALFLTRNREESEDLVQDTIYRALLNAEKFAEGTNVRAWLITIMRNLFINSYHRRKQWHALIESRDKGSWLNQKAVVHNGSSRTLLSEDISKALCAVSHTLTEPFMMHFSGFQYDEIAERLDLPIGTVKSRIYFARKELQQQLQALGITNSSNS